MSVLSTYSKAWPVSLTNNELLEILNKLSDNSSDGSIISDNEIDRVAVTIINDIDEVEETCKTFLWECMDNYSV